MGKKISKKKEVLNRLEINGENYSFITLKDHKENFNSNPTERLINLVKNKLGGGGVLARQFRYVK